MQLLHDAGQRSLGVDSNLSQVVDGDESLFWEDDLFRWLDAQEDASHRALVSMHVVEHLPLDLQIRLVFESRRVLAEGGVLILETPNTLSLSVAASNFWVDPTHLRPVHPAFLEFLSVEAGFARSSAGTGRPARRRPWHRDGPRSSSRTSNSSSSAVETLRSWRRGERPESTRTSKSGISCRRVPEHHDPSWNASHGSGVRRRSQLRSASPRSDPPACCWRARHLPELGCAGGRRRRDRGSDGGVGPPAAPKGRIEIAAAGAAVALALAFGAGAGFVSSQHITIDRDPGSYVSTAQWLVEDGSLVVDGRADEFEDVAGLRYQSAAVYDVGDGELEFQFNHFASVPLAVAYDVGGYRLMFRTPAIMSALGLLALFCVTRAATGRPLSSLVAPALMAGGLPLLYASPRHVLRAVHVVAAVGRRGGDDRDAPSTAVSARDRRRPDRGCAGRLAC